MVKEIEGNFKIGDAGLYTKTWLPDSTPRAKLVFVHGFSDHCGRYYGFFPYLANRGIAVYGWDQRGWGQSVLKPAMKGLTGPTTQVLSDMASFIESVRVAEPTNAPLFVLGHSMGGGEVLTLASTKEYEDSVVAHVRGWLLEAPFIGFAKAEEPSSLKVWAGRLAGKLLPKMHLVNVIPPEHLSRDPAVQKSLQEDTLLHNTGTLEGLSGLLDRTAALGSGNTELSTKVKSLWLGHGDQDMATSYEASKSWFEKQETVEDKTFRTYEGWFHQMHAEPGKEEFYEDVGDWILARCDGGQRAAAAPQVSVESEAPSISEVQEGTAKGDSKL